MQAMGAQTEAKEDERSFNALVGDVDKAVRAVIEARMQSLAEYSMPVVGV